MDGPVPFGRRERHEGSNSVPAGGSGAVHRACAPRRRARAARRGHLEHRTRPVGGIAGHLRHRLGCGRNAGVQRGGPDAGRGTRDLRVRGDRRLRLGDGDRGRLPAVRHRRRCTRGRIGRSGGRGSGASHPRPLPAGPGGEIIDPAYTASLSTIADGQAKTDGVATGEQVADLLIAERADDGFRAAVTYTPPNPPIPGVWLPTAATPPIGTYLGLMRPFSLESADQFRPDRRLRSTVGGGCATTTRQADRLEHEHEPDRRADAGGQFWAEPRSSRHAARSASSCWITHSMSWTRRGSWG